MADNEIKVKISAENVEFLRKIQECIKALGEQEKAVEDANGNDIKPPTSQVPKWLQDGIASAERFMQQIRLINDGLINAARIAATVKFPPQNQQINVDVSGAQRAIANLGALFRGLADITPKLGVDVSDAKARIQELAGEISKIKNATVKVDIKGVNAENININLDTALAKQKIRDLQRLINDLKSNGIKIDINMSGAVQTLDTLQKNLNKLKSANIKVEVDAGTTIQTIKGIASELQKIKSRNIRISLNANVTAAEINKVNALLGKLKSTSVTVNVNTASAISNLNRLKTLAIEVQQALTQIRLPNIDTAGVTALLTALRRLEHQARSAQGAINQIHAPRGGSTGGGSGGLLGPLSQLTVVAAGALTVLRQIKDVAASIVMPGFNYTKDMETSKLGIAGILTSMTNLDGKAMDFASAMSISADMMKKLQKDAILTSATTEEMVTTFRALLAPGLGAGMNIDQIEEFTKVGVNAVKAMGLNNVQFAQELRDLVQGGIQASSSTLATSLGLNDADIKAARASSEGLFKFLMDRMAGFTSMAEEFPKTLAGKLSMLEEFATLASAKITEAFKPEIKAVLDLVTGLFGTMNKEAGEFELNPTILKFVDMLKFGIDEVIELFGQMNEKGQFEVNPEVTEFFDGLGEGIRAVWDLIVSLGSAIDTLFNNDSFSLVKDYWLPILSDLWTILVDVLDMFTSVVTVIDNLVNALIGAGSSFQKKFSDAVVWAVSKLKEFIHIAKLGWDMLVKLSGGAPKKGDNGTNWQEKSKEQEKRNKKEVDRNLITTKNQSKAAIEAAKKADKERIKASQDALKEMLKYWKNQLDDIQREFKKREEALRIRLDQGKISKDDSYRQTLQDDIAEKDRQIKVITGQIESTQGALYEKPAEKQSALNELYRQRDVASAEMKDLTKALHEMFTVMGKMNSMTPEQAINKYGLDPAGFEQSNSANSMYKHAQQTAAKIGVPPEWVYAQWGHESGNFKSKLAKENNNFGGLTQVENNGAENKQPDGGYYYMKFESPGKYAEYFARYIKKYYPDAANAKTVEAYVSALKSGGYFGDDYDNYLSGVKAHMGNPVQTDTGEGNTWYKVAAENPKYDALESNAKQALEQVAAYFNKLTGEQLGLTSGKRSADLGYASKDIGGHYTGMKFDATAEALKDSAIRQKVIDFAKGVGIDVLDEYDKPTAKASGKHLDFNVANFKTKNTNQEPDIGELQTRQAYEMYTGRMEMREKAKGFLRQYHGLMGDISSYQIEDITKQYKKIRDELALYPNDDKAREALQVIDKLEASEKAKVNFAQVQQELEKANADLANAQMQMFSEFEAGSKTSTQVTNEYAKKFSMLFEGTLTELRKQFEDATNRNDDQAIRTIRNKMRDVINTMVDGFKAILDAIDKQTNEEIAKIQLRKDLTTGQKDTLVDEAKQKGLRSKIAAGENEIKQLESQRNGVFNVGLENKITNMRKQLEQLNYELSQTPTYIDKVHMAGKQGLEDGLNSFFSDVLSGCKGVSAAFQDLANSILQSITKVLANRLTQQFMGMLGGGAKAISNPWQLSNGTSLDSNFGFDMGSIFGGLFATGGSIENGGKVNGPGTGTSDNILAWSNRFKKFIGIGDGEYVINSASVKRFGTNFFDHVNNGMIPPEIYRVHEMYANGGNLSGANISSMASPASYTAKGDNIVNVPVDVHGVGNPKMSSELRNEIEDVVIKVLRKYS